MHRRAIEDREDVPKPPPRIDGGDGGGGKGEGLFGGETGSRRRRSGNPREEEDRVEGKLCSARVVSLRLRSPPSRSRTQGFVIYTTTKSSGPTRHWNHFLGGFFFLDHTNNLLSKNRD